jgi:PAS domain S-box-containing protein
MDGRQKIEIERSHRYLESILMSVIDPVIVVSPEGRIQDINKAALFLSGFDKEEDLLGSPIEDWFDPTEEICLNLSDRRVGSACAAKDFRNLEVSFRARANVRVPALLSGSVLRDTKGTPMGTVLLVRDITDRKRMEEQLNAYTLKLERSNRELQEFAAFASHDLQEPLRKIMGFSDLLSSKYGKSLNAEALDFLKRMRSAAGRMQALMDSLLTYSRVASKAEPFTVVDLNTVLGNVLIDLEWRIKQTGARIEIKNLGTIEAEPNQMQQLFQNLVGNALKFHGKKKPVIRIYCRQNPTRSRSRRNCPQERFCKVYVEDNGIGFDEKELDRIFAPFQRLHGRNEYEGTGMGLAICSKIVERHGGSIKAWSTPGKGATFLVFLPFRQHPAGDARIPWDQLRLYEEEQASSRQ